MVNDLIDVSEGIAEGRLPFTNNYLLGTPVAATRNNVGVQCRQIFLPRKIFSWEEHSVCFYVLK